MNLFDRSKTQQGYDPTQITMLRLTAPLLQDYAYIAARMREDERAQFLAFSGLAEYVPDACALACANLLGPVWLLLADDEPIVVGGFDPIRPGVYEGWQMGTEAGWEAHGLEITRHTRSINDDMFARDGVHRLQLCALAGREQAFDWYERGLGYAREATLVGFCANGADAIMFARTKKGSA